MTSSTALAARAGPRRSVRRSPREPHHRVDQLLHRHRLVKGVDPRLGTMPLVDRMATGHHDDRDAVDRRVIRLLGEKLEAVHPGETKVEEHQAESLATG